MILFCSVTLKSLPISHSSFILLILRFQRSFQRLFFLFILYFFYTLYLVFYINFVLYIYIAAIAPYSRSSSRVLFDSWTTDANDAGQHHSLRVREQCGSYGDIQTEMHPTVLLCDHRKPLRSGFRPDCMLRKSQHLHALLSRSI